MDEIIPLWLVNILSFITVFSVMAAIGTTIAPSVSIQHLRSPALLIRGLINVLVIVPIVGFAATFAFGLSLPEQVGVVLMVIAPGAPLALRRALEFWRRRRIRTNATNRCGYSCGAGCTPMGDRRQLDIGFVDAAAVARQVFLAQLLPVASGVIVRRVTPVRGAQIGRALGRAGAVLLIVALLSVLVNVRYSILLTHFWPIASAAVITIVALVAGHLLGNPSPEIRHAIAIAGAMRNVGLALLVATANQTPPMVEVIIISYAITALIIVSVYTVLWNKGVTRT